MAIEIIVTHKTAEEKVRRLSNQGCSVLEIDLSQQSRFLRAFFLPMPYGALYAETKHAIEGYSESLDHELRTRGIRVSVIEPAYTKTPFDANFLEPDAKLDEYLEARAAVNKRVKEVMATAEEPRVVADVVLKAAIAARPKIRYTAGGLASRLRLLRRFAPAGLVDAGIRRDLRLDALAASPPRTPVLAE